jgi:hypothetical protein
MLPWQYKYQAVLVKESKRCGFVSVIFMLFVCLPICPGVNEWETEKNQDSNTDWNSFTVAINYKTHAMKALLVVVIFFNACTHIHTHRDFYHTQRHFNTKQLKKKFWAYGAPSVLQILPAFYETNGLISPYKQYA